MIKYEVSVRMSSVLPRFDTSYTIVVRGGVGD